MKNRQRKRELTAIAFILPNFLGFICLTLLPVCFSFVLSFCEWNSSNPMKFVGIDNYVGMINDETFRISMKNTIIYVLGTVPTTLFLSLGLALLLNCKIKGRVFFRSIAFFPYVASLVAVAVVWNNALFHPDMGPVNSLLSALGVTDPPRWAASTTWALPTVIGLAIWKSMGYYMVVYLAGLQSVPQELYEAARIDGAGAWKRFVNITWPMITPTTFFVSIMLTIGAFKVFDTIYITTQGGPGRATNVLVYYIYKSAFVSFKFGYASAVAVVLFLIVLLITIFQFRTEKKFVSYL
ncbi:MAG: sugar ABC transporter permease [Acetatifactor sp.]|nr:sugar ABC transporter permease [Acetatifactor sp.]